MNNEVFATTRAIARRWLHHNPINHQSEGCQGNGSTGTTHGTPRACNDRRDQVSQPTGADEQREDGIVYQICQRCGQGHEEGFSQCGCGVRFATTSKHAERKATPVYSGVLKYFPLALQEIARCSVAGNEQHNPGTPLHWDRSKSGDELDALARHMLDAGTRDDDDIWHDTKMAWRSLANLEKLLEQQ
jgi:hypothetical protein